MSLDAGTTPTVRLARATAGDKAGIQAAIELGNGARARLGHLPYAAYYDAARKGTLLLAYHGDPREGEQVIGYAYYRPSRGRVRLEHLCVAPSWHGRGLAHRMVDWISREHAGYSGILAKCRASYHLGGMWIALGFKQISEGPGRSRAGHVLVSWWRDHGHPDLFSQDEESVLVRAAIDVNVVRDLAEDDREDASEAQALLADHVADRLELVRTAALDAEIDEMTGPLRARCTARVRHLVSPRSDPTLVRQIRDELTDAARRIEASYPRSDQDRFDVSHVAEAIAAGLHVFATRDEHLARVLGEPARQRGLRILRPGDVVVHVDELARAEAYRPAALLGTSYQRQLLGAGRDDDLTGLVNQAAGEKPRTLVKAPRDLALDGYQRAGIYAAGGDPVALVAVKQDGAVLDVPMLRVANIPLADTVARQLVFQLRQQARELGATIIRIRDRYLSAPARLAALNDGFRQQVNDHQTGSKAGDRGGNDAGFYAFVVDCCGPADQVEHHAVVAARRSGMPEPASLRSSMPAVAAAELERVWWPAKLTDSLLPSYVVAIQQGFSADLLGVPQILLPRQDNLGLAREHVYYRSPTPSQLQAPARLLWYMSSGGHSVSSPPAVIACSQLDAILTGTADELYDRFRHLGVWDLAHVHSAARDGQVQALRFTNTELLTPIPLGRLREIAAAHGQKGVPPQWPQLISRAMFAALYEEGRRR